MRLPSIIFLLTIFICSITDLQSIGDKEYKIDKRIILQEGLSQSRILSTIEDSRGFMWFGTADGLNRYDGYIFKIFRNIFNDSTSLPNNVVNSMVEDDNGNIWIGTNNGIAVFNPYTETFISLKEIDSTKIILGANLIKSCVIDNQMNIWCSTSGYGVIKINPSTFKKEYFFFSETDSLYLNEIYSLYIDRSNRLWIGSYLDRAISVYDIDKAKLSKYQLQGIDKKEKKSLKIHSIFEDSKSRMWISIVDYNDVLGSLFFLNKKEKSFQNYKQFLTKDFIKHFSYSFNTIISITDDNDGNIWFASLLSGVFKFKFGDSPTAYYVDSPLTDSRINLIYRSVNGILWIGTNGNGIELSIPDNTDFKLMSNKINDDFSIESIRTFEEDNIYYWVSGYYGMAKIKKDFTNIEMIQPASYYSIVNSTNKSNILWVGSEGGGLQKINKRSNKLSNINYAKSEFNENIVDFIFKIHPISDTLLLLGTNSGLVGFNPIKKTITPYPFITSSANIQLHKMVRTIYKDSFNNILIGYVQGGIGIFNPVKKNVVRYRKIIGLNDLVNYNPVNCIYNDNKNRYWIGTSNGLIRYEIGSHNSKLFTEADGLPNSHIYGILPDDEGNLWLSTNNGISCYSPSDKTFRNYDVSDGLQNNEFNTGAYFKAKDGTLFFGGINGFNYFNPKKIKQNSIVPHLVITGIKISNKYLKISKKDLSKSILTIQPHQEVFTIEFAGLSFINSTKNQYKYKILELNEEWIQLGNQHQITFNNLLPGKYTLEILASNNHGLWLSEPHVCKIVVLPTFFESVIFKWIVLVIIIILILTIYKVRLRQITKQKNRLQLFADQQTVSLLDANKTLKDEVLRHETTTDELTASNKTKDKFLSIIAHDIINPLGVIVGFSDLLVDTENDFSEDDKSSFIKTINTTSKGLTSLLSNLLQWSRIQNKSIIPKPKSFLLKSHVLKTISLLQGNINEKEIKLIINIDNETSLFTDTNMLSTILRNLLSNAIKFTPAKGQIKIEAKQIKDMLQVNISDTGVGIPEENLPKLFNPDETISTKGTNNESGTGLGLALVYEFVIINGGKIWVTSELNKGTTFYFTLPLKK